MIRWQWRSPRRSRSIAVQQAEQDWQHTFDAIPNAVALVAPDRTVMRTNRAATDALGLAPGALARRPCYQALYGRSAACPGCPLDKALATRDKTFFDTWHPATGALYEARLFPLEDGDGRIVGAVEVAQDVTASQKLREDLQDTERLRVLGEMASGLAFGVNDLLSSVIGGSRLLRERVSDPAMRRSLDRVAQSATEGAAGVARIQSYIAERREEAMVLVNPNDVVRDVLRREGVTSRSNPKHPLSSRQTVVDLGATGPTFGYPLDLREALRSLLANAIEATSEKGTIAIKSWTGKGAVHISVADNGSGMDDDTKAQATKLFFTTKGDGAFGLGLSIVQHVVTSHWGDLKIESAAGGGTTVTLSLPAAAPEADDGTPSAVSGKRVLVADRDVQACNVLAQTLEVDRHHVIRCTDTASTLQLLEQQRFDVVFTALAMPPVTSWLLARAAADGACAPRSVLVTPQNFNPFVEGLSSLGVDGMLPKPFNLAAVRTCLARVFAEG